MSEKKSELVFNDSSNDGVADNSIDTIALGKRLYKNNCMSCHGSLENSDKLGTNYSAVKSAIQDVSSMSHLSFLTDNEISEVVDVLKFKTQEFKYPEIEPLCINKDEIADSDSKFLTPEQLKNTIIDIFGVIAYNSIKSEIESLITKPVQGEFSTFDVNIDSLLVKSYMKIFKALVPHAVVAVRNEDNCLKPSGNLLKSSVDSTCLGEVLEEWGLRIFRRPLSLRELDDFQDTFEKIDNEDFDIAFGGVLSTMLLNPNFLFLIENRGGLVGNKYQLTDYEMASRLSFTLLRTTPSDQLLLAAKNGELTSEEKLEGHIDSLINDTRTKKVIKEFYKEWLQVENEVLDSYTDHFLNPTLDKMNSVNIYQSAQEEIDRFLDYILFNKKGTLEDLFLSNWVNLSGLPELANVYGVTTNDRVLDPYLRSGILTRSALHITGSNWKHPMKFGAMLRRHVLCDELPDPPDDFEIPETKIDPISIKSSRERFEQLVSSPNCFGCHKSINGLAFAFDNIDSLGRNIDEERVYGPTANFIGEVSVNTLTKPFIYNGDNSMASDGVELTKKIIAAPKTKQCFSKKLTSFYIGRKLSEDDGCLVDEISKNVVGKKSLLFLVKEILMSKNFKMKKIKQ